MRVPPIAASQEGLFTRAQARDAGIAHSSIRRWLDAGDLIEVVSGVLTSRATPVTVALRIRASTLANSGIASHWSAMHVLRLDHDHPVLARTSSRPREFPLHVTTQRGQRLRLPAEVVGHRSTFVEGEVREREGIRVTSVQRTIADLLAMLPLAEGRALAFRARQQGWLTGDDLARAIEHRVSWSGTAKLVAAVPIFDADAHSVGEWLLREALLAIPGMTFAMNVSVRCTSGQVFVLDAVIDGIKLAIEFDGRRYHGADRFVQDRRRQNALIMDGWTLLRFTWDDFVGGPERVAAAVGHVARSLRAA